MTERENGPTTRSKGARERLLTGVVVDAVRCCPANSTTDEYWTMKWAEVESDEDEEAQRRATFADAAAKASTTTKKSRLSGPAGRYHSVMAVEDREI